MSISLIDLATELGKNRQTISNWIDEIGDIKIFYDNRRATISDISADKVRCHRPAKSGVKKGMTAAKKPFIPRKIEEYSVSLPTRLTTYGGTK